MPTFPVGNMSAIKGMEVTVYLSGLGDQGTYYCTATGTGDGDSMCDSGSTG